MSGETQTVQGDARDSRRTTWWPLASYYFVMAIWAFVAFPIVDRYVQSGAATMAEPVMMALFGGVVGKLLFCVMLAGWLGRSWLSGLTFATLSAMLTVALMVAGSSVCSSIILVNPNMSGISAVLLVPGLMFCSATPFYLVRSWRGCFLSRDVTGAIRERPGSRLAIEDLFVAILVVAACLLFTRLPQAVWGIPANQFWPSLLPTIAIFGQLSLLSVFPWSLRLFTAKTKSKQRIIFFRGPLLFLLAVVVFARVSEALSGRGFNTPESIMYFGPGIFGASLTLGAGIFAFAKSGYQLTWPATDPSRTAETFDVTDRVRNRGIAVGLLVVAVCTGFIQGRIQSTRRMGWQEQVALGKHAAEFGGRIQVDDSRQIVNIELGTSATDATLGEFSHLRHVKRISLSGSRVTDAGIQIATAFPRLEELDLTGTGITSASVPSLLKIDNLSRLSIARTSLTADDVLAMTAARPLRSLDISEMRLSKEELVRIATRHRGGLSFRGYQLDDAAVARVLAEHTFADLADPAQRDNQSLDLGGNPIDGSCLKNYKEKLFELKLHDTKLTDETFGPVSQNLQVERLHIANTRLTDTFLFSLEKAKKILGFQLGSGDITEEGLAQMKRVQFRYLALNAKQFTGECFKTWKPQLRQLDMSGSGLNDATVKDLRGLVSCQNINLSNTDITDVALPELAKLNVNYLLNLSGTAITADGLAKGDLKSIARVEVAFGQFNEQEIRRIREAGVSLVVGGATSY